MTTMKTLLAAAALAALTLTASSARAGACHDAKQTAATAADELESTSRRLMSCASNHNFSDDCYSEMLRVKSAHDDYEAAVSNVSTECD
jgi:hypothetical protein